MSSLHCHFAAQTSKTSKVSLRLQLPGLSKAEKREEIFTDLLDVLRYDPQNRLELGAPELLHLSEENFGAFCLKHKAAAPALVSYCKRTWRRRTRKGPPALHCCSHTLNDNTNPAFASFALSMSVFLENLSVLHPFVVFPFSCSCPTVSSLG
jgi:hypothetical protein